MIKSKMVPQIICIVAALVVIRTDMNLHMYLCIRSSRSIKVSTHKYYEEEVNLPLCLGLSLLKIIQNRKIWPPEVPVYER